MVSVTLGQLFIMRRDLKQLISEVEGTLRESYCHREDTPVPPVTEQFDYLYDWICDKRAKLARFDLLVNEANSRPNTVEFEGESFSLAEARLVKASLVGVLGTAEYHLRAGLVDCKSEVTEQIWDTEVTPPVLRPKRYKMLPLINIKKMKEEVRKAKAQISTIDALIQKADWSLTIDLEDSEVGE